MPLAMKLRGPSQLQMHRLAGRFGFAYCDYDTHMRRIDGKGRFDLLLDISRSIHLFIKGLS